MMLDLDLNLNESDETPSENQFPELQLEYSGAATSNSSVVNASNAGDQEYMYPCEHNFDILKQNNLQDDKNVRLVTKQLFPDGCSEEREFNSRQQYYHRYNLQIKKTRRGPRSRSSQYRGVTYYRRTGRWESHIWDSGKQVYLGGFDTAHDAARTYDQAAIRFRGIDADINFNPHDYKEHLKQIMNLTKEEVVHILRRQGNGFSSGSSKYRGVTRHRWEAMGQFLDKKAYDKSAIKCNGREAVTNFEPSPSSYEGEATSQTDNGANSQSMDLNLGIAPPSFRSSNYTNDTSWNQINHLPVDMSEARRTRIEPSTSMTLGPQMPLVHHPHRKSTTSRFFPLYQGTSIEKCKKADSSNQGWQVQGPYGGVIPTSLFSAATAAASSGFDHSVTGASSLAAARHHYTPPIHKFR